MFGELESGARGATLLAEMPFAENQIDFRTALYFHQYHPRALENRYKIIEGANGTWTQNSDGTLVFRANGDFSKFTGVKVDGTLIDAKNYTAVSGSTVITLKTDYLKTLSVGTHKLTVVYTDGECSTNFEVKQTTQTEGDKPDTTTPTGNKDTTSPQTGDNSNLLLWVALLFVSGAGVIGATVYSKKKRVR